MIVSKWIQLFLALFALPQALSCSDSATFTFGSYSYNNSRTTRDCAWILKQNVETRRDKWCTYEHEGTAVQDECPSACDLCHLSPSIAPTQQPSRVCVDSTLRLKIPTVGTRPKPFVSRYCSWVGNQDKKNRCALPGVSAACPVTCGACSACKDPDELRFKFKYNGKTMVRNCDFIGRLEKKVYDRCTASDNICRSTCGSC
mmetsp:Transcript_9571/g.12042  ORF Transcript_9571/g.12042 Transcript_9571/m.12042 type:complete len:201 (+) Transcript_9571:58-660(+)